MIGQRLACAHPVPERRSKPHPTQLLKCPRCDSFDTKFCYYNNYSLTQPRYFCKSCKRYWTDGGALRNVPVGGGLRKNKRSKQKTPGQSDPAPKAAISDTLCNEKSHLATLGGTQDSPNAQETPNFRYLNPPLDEKFSYDSARRLYSETGEHHYMYGEVRNVPQFFPGYSYGMAMEGGSGLSHYEGGYLGYNNNFSGPASSDQQAHSNNSGEMSDVLEATPREPNLEQNCSNHAASELHFAPIPHQNQAPNQHLHHRHSHIQEAAIDNRRSSSSPYSKSTLPTTSELLPSTKSNGLSVPELKSEEPNNGVINPYDWQLISEGLFGSNGDYLYMPAAAGSWPDLSHFDSGPG